MPHTHEIYVQICCPFSLFPSPRSPQFPSNSIDLIGLDRNYLNVVFDYEQRPPFLTAHPSDPWHRPDIEGLGVVQQPICT